MAQEVAQKWLSSYANALSSFDADTVANSFLLDGWLRDVLTFTWDIRALEGRQKIVSYLKDSGALRIAKISDVELSGSDNLTPTFIPILKPGSAINEGIEAYFSFETHVGHGRGCVRLLRDESDGGGWKALTVSMILDDLQGHEEAGSESGIYGGHTLAWSDVNADRRAKVEQDPHVLIIGAGQTGLQVAARFKQMKIPTLVIDRNERIGDNWRKRYPTLVLHTPKDHHQFLYQPYPHNWPFYTPRDKLADWMESYATSQDLVVWMNSEIANRPTYDPISKKWTVVIIRNKTQAQIHPTHIVLATGTLGTPRIPTLSNQDQFRGTILHGSQYAGGKPFTGKQAVVVGAGNTSIDICQDLHHHKAKSVTMVQRSSTCVVTGDTVVKHMEDTWVPGKPIEIGDFRFASVPLGLQKKIMQGMTDLLWEEEKVLHEKLRKGGVKLNMGPEGQGQFLLVFERGGGYWLDKGGSDLIASGDVKVKQGVQPTAFNESGLVFEDGSVLEADVVIFATGYNNMRDSNKRLFGIDVIDRTSEVYGLDEEGELRGSYRPSGHPGLWYASGDFHCSRFMSKHLAIQIKALELGLMSHPNINVKRNLTEGEHVLKGRL